MSHSHHLGIAPSTIAHVASSQPIAATIEWIGAEHREERLAWLAAALTYVVTMAITVTVDPKNDALLPFLAFLFGTPLLVLALARAHYRRRRVGRAKLLIEDTQLMVRRGDSETTHNALAVTSAADAVWVALDNDRTLKLSLDSADAGSSKHIESGSLNPLLEELSAACSAVVAGPCLRLSDTPLFRLLRGLVAGTGTTAMLLATLLLVLPIDNAIPLAVYGGVPVFFLAAAFVSEQGVHIGIDGIRIGKRFVAAAKVIRVQADEAKRLVIATSDGTIVTRVNANENLAAAIETATSEWYAKPAPSSDVFQRRPDESRSAWEMRMRGLLETGDFRRAPIAEATIANTLRSARTAPQDRQGAALALAHRSPGLVNTIAATIARRPLAKKLRSATRRND